MLLWCLKSLHPAISIIFGALVLGVQNVGGNASKSGIQKGDTVIYASSFFGDELWPTDSKGLTNSAISAAPSPVALVYVRATSVHLSMQASFPLYFHHPALQIPRLRDVCVGLPPHYPWSDCMSGPINGCCHVSGLHTLAA